MNYVIKLDGTTDEEIEKKITEIKSKIKSAWGSYFDEAYINHVINLIRNQNNYFFYYYPSEYVDGMKIPPCTSE